VLYISLYMTTFVNKGPFYSLIIFLMLNIVLLYLKIVLA